MSEHPSKEARVPLKASGGAIELKALLTYRSHMHLKYERANEVSVTLQLYPSEARALARALDEMAEFMEGEG